MEDASTVDQFSELMIIHKSVLQNSRNKLRAYLGVKNRDRQYCKIKIDSKHSDYAYVHTEER